jgi:hypothetical protein
MALMTFEEVVTSLKAKKRPMSLLMGNGFSMAYDREIFSYNALYDFLVSKEDELLNKLFSVIKTKNFELVMQQLDTTLALLDAFGSDPALGQQIQSARQKLKETLLKSVQELHPEHVYKLPDEKSAACAAFLSTFLDSGGQIYTTNYDLLLYWVLMRQGVNNPIDGFGREVTNFDEVKEGAEAEHSDLFWGPNRDDQNVHYLHGALHLFDAGSSVVKEQYSVEAYLLQNISARLEKGEYPIFVTAGTSDEKLEHIRHNQYLSHCYDKLSTASGSLVTFGFNFGEYDEHLIDAINRAKANKDMGSKLWSIYIGVYSAADEAHIRSIEKKFRLKVTLFDAKTANVWGV